MLSAEHCMKKAQELSDRAVASPTDATDLLLLAGQWVDVARMAEWHDAQAMNELFKLNARMSL